jgi:hypothetical protein
VARAPRSYAGYDAAFLASAVVGAVGALVAAGLWIVSATAQTTLAR